MKDHDPNVAYGIELGRKEMLRVLRRMQKNVLCRHYAKHEEKLLKARMKRAVK